MKDRYDEEAVARIQQSCKHVVPASILSVGLEEHWAIWPIDRLPCQKSCYNSEGATCSHKRHIWRACWAIPRIDICNSEANEREPDHEEQGTERHSGPQGKQPEQEREDEPGKDVAAECEQKQELLVHVKNTYNPKAT